MSSVPGGPTGQSSPADRPANGEITLVGPRATILLVAPEASPLVQEFRAAVIADDPVTAIVATLSATGARNLPPFGCVIHVGTCVRVLVRGSITANVLTDGATLTISADDVTTWAEQVYVAPSEVCLESRSAVGSTRLVLLFDRPGREQHSPSTGASPEAAPASKAESPAGPEAEQQSAPDPLPEPPYPDEPESLTLTSSDFATAVEPAAEQSVSPRDDGEFDFAHLLEETHYRGVEAAAVREEEGTEASGNAHATAEEPEGTFDQAVPEAAVAPSPPTPWVPPRLDPGALISGVPRNTGAPAREPISPVPAGDHDGYTIAASALREAVAAARTAYPSPGPQVQAVRCTAGHPNPPHADRCRSCSAQISDRSVLVVARGSLGQLRFDDGLVVELDRPLLLGRNPTDGANGGGAEPFGLITLPDPERALSRVHMEMRLEGWQVLVVDRNAVNGTAVALPGKPVRRLRPDDPCLITRGTRVTLADVTSFVYEVGLA